MGWLPKSMCLSFLMFTVHSQKDIPSVHCTLVLHQQTAIWILEVYIKESNAHCSFLGPGQPVLQTRQMTFIAWACVCMPCYMFMLLQLERKIET